MAHLSMNEITGRRRIQVNLVHIFNELVRLSKHMSEIMQIFDKEEMFSVINKS